MTKIRETSGATPRPPILLLPLWGATVEDLSSGMEIPEDGGVSNRYGNSSNSVTTRPSGPAKNQCNGI